MKTSIKKAKEQLIEISPFLSTIQFKALLLSLESEESEAFCQVIEKLYSAIKQTPEFYSTENLGNRAEVFLHYFSNLGDWYVLEKQAQDGNVEAFGYVSLNDGYPELGYFSITEICRYGAQADLYWSKQNLSDLKS